jgi:hypothetical protein
MSELVSCPHCGGQMSVTADLKGQVVLCPHCQKQLTVPDPAPQAFPPLDPVRLLHQKSVSSYLVEAILVTIFCCMPFGIVAIVYAAQVDGKLASRDFTGARYVSERAKNWCLAAFLCGLVSWGAVGLLARATAHH